MAQRVGFVGVGAMGSAIASRLVDSYELWVTDLNPAAADALVTRGARFTTGVEIARECGTVFLSLPGPHNVLDLLTGDGGIGDALQPDCLIIDTTSSTPLVDQTLVAHLGARKVRYVDSPIAGGVRRAYAGESTLMVGATDDDFERAAPLLNSVTPNVFHLGPVGAGHAAKLVNNLLNACHRFSALESIRLAEEYGISRDLMVSVLNSGSGRSYITEHTYPELVAHGQPQGFTLQLMQKDVRLATELAESVGHRLPVGSVVNELADEAVRRLGPSTDQTRMFLDWYNED